MLVSFGRTAHIHGLHQLVTYLHQRLSPGSQLASPQLSSIHRLTWLGATSSSGLVGGGVKLSAVALVALAHVLGRVAGSACRVPLSGSTAQLTSPQLSPLVQWTGRWTPICVLVFGHFLPGVGWL